MAGVDTKTDIFKLRVATADLARWREAAGPRKLSAFVREVVDEYVDAALAEERDRARQERIEFVQTLTPMVERASSVKRKKREIGKSGSCEHHLPLGAFCPQCGS